MTIRWVFTDPVASTSYTVPRNPSEMTSPIPPRAISTVGTTAGGVIAYEGPSAGHTWSFKGRTVDRAHYDALMLWRSKQNRWTITDHYGRIFTVAPLNFSFTPRRNAHNYWDGEYEFSVVTLSYTAPTVGDIWS